MKQPMAPQVSLEGSCKEHAMLSRRGMLRASLATGVGLGAVATFGSAFVQTSYAATRSAPSVLVVLSMRGAVDGMSLVVPHGDPVYYAARPVIAVPSSTLLGKDGFFGLHPNLEPLMPLWNSGRMATVHATGLPAPNRSHFAAIEEVEDADPGSDARVGWLNRLIGRDSYDHPLRAVQFGDSVPPTSLAGPRSSIAVEKIHDVQLAGGGPGVGDARRAQSMTTMWGRAAGPMGAGARAAMRAVVDFGPVRATDPTPANGASYPPGDLGKALASSARTIRGDVGAEVITVDYGSWDHHVNLGPLDWGLMQSMSTDFARSIAAFFDDLGPLADKVTLVTISEFGRRVKENANYGLDHGYGNVMMLFGAGVKGGYHGTWPGLSGGVNDDLLVTTDYRSVLSEVVTKRLGASSAQVFPGFQPETVGALL